MIEIIEAGRPAGGAPRMNDPGLRHLALTVENFERLQRLKDGGVSFLTDRY